MTKPLPSFIEKLSSNGDYELWSFGGEQFVVASLPWQRLPGGAQDLEIASMARQHFIEKRRGAERAIAQIDQWLDDRAKPNGSSEVMDDDGKSSKEKP